MAEVNRSWVNLLNILQVRLETSFPANLLTGAIPRLLNHTTNICKLCTHWSMFNWSLM